MQERAAAMRARAQQMNDDSARVRRELQLAEEERAAGAPPQHETLPVAHRCPYCDAPLSLETRECPACGAIAWEAGQIAWETAQTTWKQAASDHASAEAAFDKAEADWTTAAAEHARASRESEQAEITWEGAQTDWQRLNDAQQRRTEGDEDERGHGQG